MLTKRKRAVTRSTATPGQLRIALENLTRDILAGNFTGRNPWSLDSLKDASEALTGGNWADLNSSMIPEEESN